MIDARITRRSFSAAALTAVTSTCLPRFAARAADAKDENIYFDIHTHLGQVWNTLELLDAPTLLRWMDSKRIAQAVVLPLVSPESSSYLLTSEFVLQETKPHRDRLIPFCCIDPRTAHKGEAQGFAEMLERYVDAGAKGFGEHKTGIAIDDPRNMAIYEACSLVKLPVLFHLDNLRNMDKPGLPGLDRVLTEHPDVTFIGHGPGWWASISGEVTQPDLDRTPKTKIASGGAVDALMEKHPNLYGDLSASSGANALGRDLGFAREFLTRRQERLMFGSDFLAPGQEVRQFELFEQQLGDLPADVQAKIFRGNARRVLGLT